MAIALTPSELRARLRHDADAHLWPSALVRADLGAGRLELEAAVYSLDDVGFFAVGDHVKAVGPTFEAPAAATIAAIDARTITLEPPLAARAGDFVNLVQLAPEV